MLERKIYFSSQFWSILGCHEEDMDSGSVHVYWKQHGQWLCAGQQEYGSELVCLVENQKQRARPEPGARL